jgi:hypothetical protein
MTPDIEIHKIFVENVSYTGYITTTASQTVSNTPLERSKKTSGAEN